MGCSSPLGWPRCCSSRTPRCADSKRCCGCHGLLWRRGTNRRAGSIGSSHSSHGRRRYRIRICHTEWPIALLLWGASRRKRAASCLVSSACLPTRQSPHRETCTDLAGPKQRRRKGEQCTERAPKHHSALYYPARRERRPSRRLSPVPRVSLARPHFPIEPQRSPRRRAKREIPPGRHPPSPAAAPSKRSRSTRTRAPPPGKEPVLCASVQHAQPSVSDQTRGPASARRA